jgi:hypothetical protein
MVDGSGHGIYEFTFLVLTWRNRRNNEESHECVTTGYKPSASGLNNNPGSSFMWKEIRIISWFCVCIGPLTICLYVLTEEDICPLTACLCPPTDDVYVSAHWRCVCIFPLTMGLYLPTDDVSVSAHWWWACIDPQTVCLCVHRQCVCPLIAGSQQMHLLS